MKKIVVLAAACLSRMSSLASTQRKSRFIFTKISIFSLILFFVFSCQKLEVDSSTSNIVKETSDTGLKAVSTDEARAWLDKIDIQNKAAKISADNP